MLTSTSGQVAKYMKKADTWYDTASSPLTKIQSSFDRTSTEEENKGKLEKSNVTIFHSSFPSSSSSVIHLLNKFVDSNRVSFGRHLHDVVANNLTTIMPFLPVADVKPLDLLFHQIRMWDRWHCRATLPIPVCREWSILSGMAPSALVFYCAAYHLVRDSPTIYLPT